ncbi:C45 family autoproteolytic acyltransferase/hydrolase [Alteribacillus sp. JSM 102045]|uniref:C45 family autoproteolytic acyltransferase/hydolase n=1 Tax=Alteribacillus sp. JSM 102045 TaxID=1562101 RepID=UPI0035BEB6D6
MKFIIRLLSVVLVAVITISSLGLPFVNAEEEPILYLKGSSIDIGEQYGEQAKEEIKHNISLFKKAANQSHSKLSQAAHEYESFLEEKSPEILERLRAMAESAGVNYQDLLALNALGEEFLGEGCTTVLAAGDATKSGNAYYHKNRDARIGSKQVVVQMEPEDGQKYIGITSAGYSGMAMGINEKGVSVGNNVLSTWDIGPGYGNLDVIRMTLEEAADAESAVDFIQEVPRQSGSSYGIADNEDAAFVEATHSAAAVKWIEDEVMAHTNHFILDGMEKYDALDFNNLQENPWSWYVSTKERLSRATGLIDQNFGSIDARTLIKLSEDQDGPDSTYWIDSQTELKGIPMGSVSTGTFDGSKLRMWSQLGQPSDVPAIPFDADRPHIPEPFNSGKAQ